MLKLIDKKIFNSQKVCFSPPVSYVFQPMRHRKVKFEPSPPSRPLACALLGKCVSLSFCTPGFSRMWAMEFINFRLSVHPFVLSIHLFDGLIMTWSQNRKINFLLLGHIKNVFQVSWNLK